MQFEKERFFEAKAWPFEEAKNLLARTQKAPDKKVLFETGYGPSGLPHIGTFGEVVRTLMVQYAFSKMTNIPSEVICFSDDMDGMRKVPTNIPNQEKLRPFLDFPLTKVPDPFGEYESFGAHNNARLRAFLDAFEFKYTFLSSTECYEKGLFDEMLLKVLERHQEILKVMLPTLREERRKTYSPFLPVSPKSGRVLQVLVDEYRVNEGTIVFRDEDGTLTEVPVIGGNCKLQWKIDWGMRWAAFGIDYEMAGKDLIDSAKLSTKICRILGVEPPHNFIYEHFLDERGEKISKSKGNGLSMEEWLYYAPEESLAYFMYLSPKRAKRLYFDVIPRCVDEYLTHLEKFKEQDQKEQLENPVWHVHQGNPPEIDVPVSFGMLLNLASVCNAEDKEILWKFIKRYDETASPEGMPFFDRLVEYAVRYYKNFVAPYKIYREPTQEEKKALEALLKSLNTISLQSEAIQKEIFEIGKRHSFSNLKDWFSCLYEVLLGQKEGPRMGSFIALYGISQTQELIKKRLTSALL